VLHVVIDNPTQVNTLHQEELILRSHLLAV